MSDAAPEEVFSLPDLQFRVFRDSEGGVRWEGMYQQIPVLDAFPFDDDAKCLILLDWSGVREPTFENLLCIEGDGTLCWTAELPRNHDTFVEFELRAEGLFAWSFSGHRVKLDLGTGKIIEREFVG